MQVQGLLGLPGSVVCTYQQLTVTVMLSWQWETDKPTPSVLSTAFVLFEIHGYWHGWSISQLCVIYSYRILQVILGTYRWLWRHYLAPGWRTLTSSCRRWNWWRSSPIPTLLAYLVSARGYVYMCVCVYTGVCKPTFYILGNVCIPMRMCLQIAVYYTAMLSSSQAYSHPCLSSKCVNLLQECVRWRKMPLLWWYWSWCHMVTSTSSSRQTSM